MEKNKIGVLGHEMAYVEMGEGQPVVFLHGNPTSSYLWRNVMPKVAHLGRCIAPDLIGMGDSDKLPNPGPESYRFVEHREYLDRLLEQILPAEPVTLIIHDWGSALGFDWANNNRKAVAGIAYMEGIVQPLPNWSDFSEAATPLFQAFRSDAGESLILDKNTFIEKVLPGSVLRGLTDAEMAIYRAPFENREDRWPTLTWPRQIPIEGEPPDVVARVQAYADWMAENDMPKLFVDAEPGAILIGKQREFCRGWQNQTEVKVAGSHFIQEDSGPEIGRALAAWLQTAVS